MTTEQGYEILRIKEQYEEAVTLYLVSSRKMWKFRIHYPML